MSDTEIAEFMREAKNRIANGQYSDAEYFFKKITKLDPTNWQAWYGRGLCLIRHNSYETAIYAFSQVTFLAPDIPKGWYHLGFCQSQVSNFEEALFNLNKAIKLDSSYYIAMVIKAWIYHEHNNHSTSQKMIDFIKANHPEFVDNFKGKDPNTQPKDFQIAYDLLFQ